MAKKKETPTTPEEPKTPTWYLPTLGVTVEADTREEAIEIAEKQAKDAEEAQKEEAGDVDA